MSIKTSDKSFLYIYNVFSIYLFYPPVLTNSLKGSTFCNFIFYSSIPLIKLKTSHILSHNFLLSLYHISLRGIHKHTHLDRKSTRLNSSHVAISYAVFCLKKKKPNT